MSSFMNPRYADLEAYTPGEQPREQQYIKLNTNESPYPPAPGVTEAVGPEEVRQLRLYSDPVGKGLKEKLADLYAVEWENIFLANGSDDILNFAFMAFGQKGAVFPDITYGFYPVFAQLNGVSYEERPLKEDFSLDSKDYLNTGKMVVIANPNAPTGMTVSLSQIQEILKTNRGNVVVIDEAYVDFGAQSCYPLIRTYPNLLVVRTFSKSRCMAGARLGYAIGPKELIRDLEKLKYSTNPYNVNRLTLLLGERTVEEEAYYREKCAQIIRTRTYTAEALEALGFQVLPSQGNFLFVRSPAVSGQRLYEALKARGILIRHFPKERIRDFNRVTVGTREQMETFIEEVTRIVSGGAL